MTTPEERKAGYISLKEASERFGYSQDYLGQLIRKGKLEGKLVYSHVAWVTTADAIQKYIDDGNRKRSLNKDSYSTEPERSEVNLEQHDSEEAEDTSLLVRWLIRFFRLLLVLAILAVMFVFYLLTTAFGEELHSGTLVARASVTISDQFNDKGHD